jgi:hypothetical protein
MTARIPGVALTVVPARTFGFVAGSYVKPARDGVPPVRPTPSLVAQVALDEALLALMINHNRMPHRADYYRVESEVVAANELFEAEGWIADPHSYHLQPPPINQMTARRGSRLGVSYEELAFPSGYEPHLSEPGRDRWLDQVANRTARAWVVRHPDPRTWLLCLHGFGTGSPMMDITGFRAGWLNRDLGLNLAFPILPLHGARKRGRMSGDGFMSYDVVDNVHGLAQSIWDLRRMVSWLRAEGATRIGVYGISLGGYVAALLTMLDGGFHSVIAGIPPCDFPDLFAHHSPRQLRPRAKRYRLIGPEATAINGVVSPLARPCLVPWDQRFIYAGLADRLATPGQAHRLWEHWDRPRIEWYDGNHVGYVWSGQVKGFVHSALIESGLVEG